MNLRRELDPMYRNLDGALGSGITAEVVVPMLIERVAPSSVVDLGCGVGSFLKAFIDAGVTDAGRGRQRFGDVRSAEHAVIGAPWDNA